MYGGGVERIKRITQIKSQFASSCKCPFADFVIDQENKHTCSVYVNMLCIKTKEVSHE